MPEWRCSWLYLPCHVTMAFLFLWAAVVVCLGLAGLWAFRGVKVANYHVVYPEDLIPFWQTANDPKNRLVRELFVCARRNQATVNLKISCVKKSYDWIRWAGVALFLLVLMQLGVELWTLLLS
jgi:hypothetical protein